MTDDRPIRRLGPDDLARLVALADRVGWANEERRYALLLDVAEVYGLPHRASDDLIGTVTLSRYEPSFTTVGMMLVDPAHGRRGYGGRLMRHVLDVAGDATVALFATSAGRPLYEKLGFETIGENRSFRGRYSGESPDMCEPATDHDLAAIIDLDRVVVGCDRGSLLERFASFAEQLRVFRDSGEISGYAGMWRHGDLSIVGPVIASSSDAAVALAADVASRASGEVRVEVGDGRAELAAWAGATGLAHSATTSVMTLHGEPLPGDRARSFMPVTLAVG